MQSLLWPLALLLVAVLLVFLEIFVPSGGLISLLAATALFASIGLAFSQSIADGAVVLLIDLIVLPAVIALALKIWPHTPLGKMILLKRSETDDVLPETEDYHLREKMVGKHGVAKSALLPSGDVEIEGRTFDSISDGVPIDPGTPVRVVAVRTRRLVVRPLSDKEQAELAEDKDANDILSTPLDSLGIDAIDDPLA